MRLVPRALVEYFSEDFHGVPYLDEACVQRRETKTHDPRFTVIADHASGDQGLDHRVTFGVFKADVAAAPGVFTRGDQLQAVGGATTFDQRNEQVSQGQGLSPQAHHVGLGKNLQATFHHGQRGNRLRTAEVAGNAGAGGVGGLHGELPGMPEPPGQRLAHHIHQRRVDPHKRLGARSAVEVFVGAANRIIRIGLMQVDRHRARRMRQVPDAQRAALVAQCGQRRHVVHIAGLVVDVGEHHHRHVRINGLGQFGRAVHQAQGIALLQQFGQAFGDVQVGGKVARFADDDLARRCTLALHTQGGAEHFEQVDRGGIGDHHLALTRTNQWRQAIAQAQG